MAAAARLISRNASAFFLSAATVVAICLTLVRSSAIAREPDLLYYGITFDVCLTIPFLYWLFLIRPGRAPALSIVPLFLAGTLVITVLVPRGQQNFVRSLALLHAPLELWVVTVFVARFRRGSRAAGSIDDPLDRMKAVAREVMGSNRAAEALVAEIAAVYFGVLGWRRRTSGNEKSTTFHEQSGWGSIVGCIVVLIVAESIGVHLLVQQWSKTAAWVITFLDAYSILWLVGDYQAFRTRPARVTENALELRFGMRWTATIPREAILSIEPLATAEAERLRRERDYLRLSILDQPTLLMTLREAVVVEGLLGWRKVVRRIGLRPDRPEVIERLATEGGRPAPAPSCILVDREA